MVKAVRGKYSHSTLKFPLSLGVVDVQSIVTAGRRGCVLWSMEERRRIRSIQCNSQMTTETRAAV